MTSTFDNCCQRAKVHRLVTLPVQSCKMSWSCCCIFLGVCINLEYLEIWIHYFSKCNSAHHYFSKCNSAHHYLISLSASKLLFFISKCKPALIFCSSRYETVSNCCFKTISYYYFLDYLIMFQMLFLIMYKTSRFWPLV